MFCPSRLQPSLVRRDFQVPAPGAALKKFLWRKLIIGRSSPKQIGLARLITDYVTVAYMTDVYVLQEYQGKGLGTWLLSAVDETLRSWKGLRRVCLMSSGNDAWYEKALGVKEFDQGNKSGLKFMTRKGGGSVVED